MYPLFEIDADLEVQEQLFRRVSSELDAVSDVAQEIVQIPANSSVRDHLSESLLPFILREGALYLEVSGQRLLVLEPGDFIAAFLPRGDNRIDLRTEFAVQLSTANPLQLSQASQEVFAATSAGTHYLLLLLSSLDLLGNEYRPRLIPIQAGETIIEQGDSSEEVYTLTEGALEVLVDGVTVGEIQEGEIFGVIAAFTGTKRSATVRAKRAGFVLELPKSQFESLVRAQPSTVFQLIEGMSRSIVELNTKVVEQEKGSAHQ